MSGPDPFDFGTGRQAGAPPPPPGATTDRVPLRWLGLGIATSVLAAVVALLYGRAVPVAFLCWVLAGPVAIGLLAVHVLRATAVRAGPVTYTESRATVPLYWTALAVAAIGIGLSAWQIADWAGRL